MKKRSSVFTLCICAVMAAMYFVLAHFLSFKAGNLRISLASLPILLLAAFYGPLESGFAALLGEFLNQMLSYGFTVTTPLWLLPPIIRALLLSLGCMLIRRHFGTGPWKKPAWYCTVVIVSAILTTLANTGVIWLDSIIGHYYTSAYVFGDFVLRLVSGVLTALVLSLVSIPILTALSGSLQHRKTPGKEM